MPAGMAAPDSGRVLSSITTTASARRTAVLGREGDTLPKNHFPTPAPPHRHGLAHQQSIAMSRTAGTAVFAGNMGRESFTTTSWKSWPDSSPTNWAEEGGGRNGLWNHRAGGT
jgi:hypothetical protein